MYGNVINAIISETIADKPVEVGAPATVLLWTDRQPMVVTEVVRFKSGPRKGQVRMVEARRVRADRDPDKPGGIGHQNWLVRLDEPYGAPYEFWADRHGDLRIKGGRDRLVVGRAEKYHDWSF